MKYRDYPEIEGQPTTGQPAMRSNFMILHVTHELSKHTNGEEENHETNTGNLSHEKKGYIYVD